jgi:hypothetical protein
VVSAPAGAAFDAVLDWARGNGIVIHGVLPALNAVSLSLSAAELRRLRQAVPTATVEHDIWVFAPDFPNPDTPATGSGIAFRNKSLEWLGIPPDRINRGKGVRIAILDTAVQEHPALAGAAVTRLTVGDAPFPDGNGDYRGHGAAVASLLVGNGEDQVTGIAPEAELLAIEVLDDNGVGNSFDLAAGILLAVDRGATVINMSLGAYMDSSVVHQAIDEALAAGVLLVAAAGNDGSDGLTFPAAYPGVVAVSAVDARGEHADYANTDPELDFAAPGVGVYAAWADNALVSFSGTSAATPFVSGALAMLLADDATGGTGEGAGALDLLRQYADDNGAPGPDPVYGDGTLDVGRVLQREQPGIVDAALSGHYLDNDARSDSAIPVLVSAQNRGTEPLPVLEIVTDVNGKNTVYSFTDVAVGETVSVTLPLDPAFLTAGRGLTLDTRVRIPGSAGDAIPANDHRTSVIRLEPAQEEEKTP